MGNSPWDLKELDMTEQLILSLSLHPLSEIRCNPPIFFCPLCVCVCIHNSVEKANGQCSSRIGTHETE